MGHPQCVIVSMTDVHPGELDEVQATALITLAARARENARRLPLLHDRTAADIAASLGLDLAAHTRGPVGDRMLVLRTAIFDVWVGDFLASHPAGTVVELGGGLNTRPERAGHGEASWIDLDLPEMIGLRRRFFADGPRRRTIAASVADQGWLQEVADCPAPYLFVAEAVLVYLPEDQVATVLTRLAGRFPGSLLALDTYPRRSVESDQAISARKNYRAAPLKWACDDPRSLERLGWDVVSTAALTRPPAALRAQLPALYRILLPLADPLIGKAIPLTLMRARPE
jgi:O-methyltransferase involved in polyketide biosynthesis